MSTEVVRITRMRLYPTPGKNYRVAWKWLYTVHADNMCYQGEGLSWARNLAAKKAQGRKIEQDWRTP